ncbi:MAG: isopentenyl-diphosphate Delta-isomerase [Clostridium sp.]|nr:isopentenyl-diphosphate Delta-isomerase [Clostridium sp.]
MEEVILVDTNDSEIGKMEKMQAHIEGRLHRAFSIFVFNSKGEFLLQQRENGKYHSGGLWTNTCCSHPRVGEDIKEAVHRRLKEEMGFDCDLSEKKTFLYHAKFDNDLIEHELDHIFIGYYNGVPIPNKEEVENWKWISTNDLKKELEAEPDKFTYWFKFSIEDVLAIIEE